ncbi:MAG: cyanophycin synthetase [bacterium]|nr:cyanophycin synthetase [bacterium]
MNFWKNKTIHVIGIKGTGLSGLAQLLQKEGAIISGDDSAEEFPSDIILKKAGIKVGLFDAGNINQEIDLVIYSSAYAPEHLERTKAQALEIPQLSYAKALARYGAGKKTIVITGTHGKTTTTAILGQIFEAAGLDPSVLVGDIVRAWGNSVRRGSGEYFIVEGDEYQEKFRLFKPAGIIIPALDYDHVDYFKDEESYLAAFRDFVRDNAEAVLVTLPSIASKLKASAIFAEEADEKIFKKSTFGLPGAHYRSDCLLAIRLARAFGLKENDIIKGINAFKGVTRRLDLFSRPGEATLIFYDYAHHPAEIKATLEALRSRYPGKKMVAIFQPHTYSRTEAFLGEFAKSFPEAELVFFEEIYASARERKGKVGLEDLISETKKYHRRVYRFRDFTLASFLEFILANVKDPLIIFMGAGDIWQKARELGQLFPGQKGGPD